MRLQMAIMFFSLILINCHTAETEGNPALENYSGNLIPYAERDSHGEVKWGYLDEETGGIVIKAKYWNAHPFVGGFAHVVMDDKTHTSKLINRAGKIISAGKFDMVYLLTSENGKNTAALFEYIHTRIEFHLGLGFMGSSSETGFYKEKYSKYRLVNLVTGKTIIPTKEYLLHDIESVGDYFLVDSDLYQFLDNGEIRCVAKNNTALAVSILRSYFERQDITALVDEDGRDIIDRPYRGREKIDYSPYIEEKFADPDLSGAFHDLPDEFTIPFERSEPFYRGHKMLLNAPLAISERKYLLSFRDKETGRHAQGIYNESKADWELKPYFTDEVTGEWYYVVEIRQTNNPHLYQIYLKSDRLGWDNDEYFWGIFNIDKDAFMKEIYLFDGYRPGIFIVPDPISGGAGGYRFPHEGVYYRDYSRIKD